MRLPKPWAGSWMALGVIFATAATIGAAAPPKAGLPGSAPPKPARAKAAPPRPSPSPAGEFARTIAALMLPAAAEHTFGDWTELDAVKGIEWAPLPPEMLDESLPDGTYFTRHGIANLGDMRIAVAATGARTMVTHVYFANAGPAIGEGAVLDAMGRRGFTIGLARAPITPSPDAGSKWWHIAYRGKRPAWLRLDTRCGAAACEMFSLLLDETLPSMTPEERLLYADRDSTGRVVASKAPTPWDEQLASLFAALIPAQDAPAVEWKALENAGAIRWQPLPPQQVKGQPIWPDTGSHFYRVGEIDLGGRLLSVQATGTETNVLNVYLNDQRTQQGRGDAMMAMWRNGYTVTLARCGRIYSLSTENWYRVAKAGSRDVMIRRSIRCDTQECPRADENYTLALTGKLPPLAPGEVDAVDGRCPGR